MNLVSTSDDVQAAADRPGQDTETATAYVALEDASIIPKSIALSHYVNADADIIVYEHLSDAEILGSVRTAIATADSSDDDESHGVPAVPTPMTESQVMTSLDILHSFLGVDE